MMMDDSNVSIAFDNRCMHLTQWHRLNVGIVDMFVQMSTHSSQFQQSDIRALDQQKPGFEVPVFDFYVCKSHSFPFRDGVTFTLYVNLHD